MSCNFIAIGLTRLGIKPESAARAEERGVRGVQSTGARHVLRSPSRGPAFIKFFFRDTREEMLEKLRLRYVRTYVQCAK